MAQSSVRLLDDDEIVLKKTGVRFPLELRPINLRPDDMTTWPSIDGRLELVNGKLLYMPPCADIQQDVAVDAVYILRSWSAAHQQFVVGGNEASMKLGNDVRAADAAVSRAYGAARLVGPAVHAGSHRHRARLGGSLLGR